MDPSQLNAREQAIFRTGYATAIAAMLADPQAAQSVTWPDPATDVDAAVLAIRFDDMYEDATEDTPALSVRLYNIFCREGIKTLGDLVSRTLGDLLDIRNFGAQSLDETMCILKHYNLRLKPEDA